MKALHLACKAEEAGTVFEKPSTNVPSEFLHMQVTAASMESASKDPSKSTFKVPIFGVSSSEMG